MFKFPPKINIAQLPTPIHHLSSLSEEWGIDLRVKEDDLTGSGLSGNKIRKLEYLLSDAIEQGCDYIITCGATTSNHARATVIAAKRFGLSSSLILAGDRPEKVHGNLQLDLLVGARVKYISREDYSTKIKETLQEEKENLQNQGKKPYVIPTGGSNSVGLFGYVEAVQEIKHQCDKSGWRPDIIVSAFGSGGTYAGIYLGNHLFPIAKRIVGVLVCGSVEPFKDKVIYEINEACKRHDTPAPSFDGIELIDGYYGEAYAKTNSEQLRFIRHVAEIEGIILDPVYTGKAMFGLHGEIIKDHIKKNAKVLFIHTGGIFGWSAFTEQAIQEWSSLEHWED